MDIYGAGDLSGGEEAWAGAFLAPTRSSAKENTFHAAAAASYAAGGGSARSLSPSWRVGDPTQELLVSQFLRLCLIGDVDSAAALLARAPSLANALKDGREPPLHSAVRVKSFPLVQLLVRAGADATAVNAAGETAADIAASDGAATMAAYLHLAQRRR